MKWTRRAEGCRTVSAIYLAETRGTRTVQAIITENREKIAELCRAHHVRRLSVFGSAAREDFDPARSDVDLLVEFEDLGEMQYAPNYFDFLGRLDAVFGREVDLLSEKQLKNPYLRRSVEEDKVLLYAA